ncbi:MAG: BrnT family toxin [Chroococcidiopsis sp.]
MEFEWDDQKNKANVAKHGISFEEATEIFDYPMYETVDSRADYGETRYIGIGRNQYFVIFTVIYIEREAAIRIISARRATKQEKKLYYDYCTQT